jgi:hypothetical protein
MAKLEISVLAGADTKGFLASLTTQIDRLEALLAKGNTAGVKDEYTDADVAQESVDAEESFDAPTTPAKAREKTKPKKLTVEDVNAACKTASAASNFKTVKKWLKENYEIDSVQELEADQYADVIAGLTELAEG